MNKEQFDAHRNWVVSVMDWAKSKTPDWLNDKKYLDHETVAAMIAELPESVRQRGIITFEYSGQSQGSPVENFLDSTIAYLRYAPHSMGCVAIHVTFCVYQSNHSKANDRLYRLWAMDGPIMLNNLDTFYPWHLAEK